MNMLLNGNQKKMSFQVTLGIMVTVEIELCAGEQNMCSALVAVILVKMSGCN